MQQAELQESSLTGPQGGGGGGGLENRGSEFTKAEAVSQPRRQWKRKAEAVS